MAKGKYHEWLTEEGLIALQGFARNGLTDEQIAHNIGINVKTLYDWKNNHSKICNALKTSKEIADLQVENALYQKALNGDTTAMIFWLKNRQPTRWRDKHEVTNNIQGDTFIKALDRFTTKL